MTRVKICGVTSEEDVALVAAAGADAIGVIAEVPVDTPREVSLDRARDLVCATPPYVTSVLVTMGSNPDRIIERVEHTAPDALQIHGELGPGDLAYLRSNVDAALTAVIGPDERETAIVSDAVVDAFVVDSTDDSGAGGTGETHDWDRTHRLSTSIASPVILAGGLDPENVERAVETVAPYAVDVASGVESTGGVKDPVAVSTFVDRANGAGGRVALDENARGQSRAG